MRSKRGGKGPARNRGSLLERLSTSVARATGTSPAFGIALLVIVVWAATGPLFHFSDTWQLVINTGTTIVTFLMVFLIQRSQNKDSKAIHMKLDEIVAALHGASNRLIEAQNLSEEELGVLEKHYARLVEMARRDTGLGASHSIDEADRRHDEKLKPAPGKRARA